MHKSFILIAVLFCDVALGQPLQNFEIHPTNRGGTQTLASFYAILVDRKSESLSACSISRRSDGFWTGNCVKVPGNFTDLKNSTVAVDYNPGSYTTPVIGWSGYNPIWLVNQVTGKVKACGSPIGTLTTTKDGCVSAN